MKEYSVSPKIAISAGYNQIRRMKNYLLLFSLSAMALAAVSCVKDNDAKVEAPVVKGYKVLYEYAVNTHYDLISVTYDSKGRVVEFDNSSFEEDGNVKKQRRLDNKKFTYNDASFSADMVNTYGYVIFSDEMEISDPEYFKLGFDGSWNLLSVAGDGFSSTFTYNGGYLVKEEFAFEDYYSHVNEYTWKDGDLVCMEQDGYKVTLEYGKEANPFTGSVDPVLADTAFTDYYLFGFAGKRSAHLPIAMHDDFYGDEYTFRFNYIRDSEGRIVKVEIRSGAEDKSGDKVITVNY